MDVIVLPRMPRDVVAHPCRACNDTRVMQDKPCFLCRPLECAAALRDETETQATSG
jgi:hypothetical protein